MAHRGWLYTNSYAPPCESFTRWDVLWNRQTNANPDEYFVLSYQTCVTFPFLYYLLTLCCFINFCRLIKLSSYYQTLAIVGFRTFFIEVYISLMISQDIPSCETFSRGDKPLFSRLVTSQCKKVLYAIHCNNMWHIPGKKFSFSMLFALWVMH